MKSFINVLALASAAFAAAVPVANPIEARENPTYCLVDSNCTPDPGYEFVSCVRDDPNQPGVCLSYNDSIKARQTQYCLVDSNCTPAPGYEFVSCVRDDPNQPGVCLSYNNPKRSIKARQTYYCLVDSNCVEQTLDPNAYCDRPDLTQGGVCVG